MFSLFNKPYASRCQFLSDLEELAESIDSYANFLKTSNEVQLRNQSLSHPVRQIKDHVYFQHVPPCATVAEVYRKSNTVINESDEYLPVFFNVEKHLQNQFDNRNKTYRYFKEIRLGVPLDLLR